MFGGERENVYKPGWREKGSGILEGQTEGELCRVEKNGNRYEAI